MKLNMNGIVAAKGFKVGGEHIGIKKVKKDMALLTSDVPCVYAGAFTQNKVKAAPVIWDEERLKQKNKISAIVVNSGNANAMTGKQGFEDTMTMAKQTAQEIGVSKENVLVCSTGVIGVPLPIELIEKGIQKVSKNIGNNKVYGHHAAQAILTTDTFSKEIAIETDIKGKTVTLGAIGKGSGMIHPNMATMLVFVLTDVNITQPMLQKALSQCVEKTFNMITVDGDSSTNDSVIVLSNGMAQNPVIDSEGEAFNTFCEMLFETLKYQAISIVKDGEGATKLLEVQLKGAKDFLSGKALAKSILTSSLVKTAFFGEDANWGRILAAMGNSGEDFDVNQVTLVLESACGKITLFQEGIPVKFKEAKAKEILGESEVLIKLTLAEGDEEVTAWGCDLGYDYIKINGEYRS